MDFIHAKEYMNSGDVVIIDCSHESNVMLMDDSNFNNYKRGRKFNYYGGHYKMFPARIGVPSTGNWNVVIDLGGGSARINYSINVERNS